MCVIGVLVLGERWRFGTSLVILTKLCEEMRVKEYGAGKNGRQCTVLIESRAHFPFLRSNCQKLE